MSLTKSLCATVGTLTALLIVLSTACDQDTVFDLPAPRFDTQDPLRDPPFVAFVSSDRPRLIRDDSTDGFTDVVVTTSQDATFRWCVEVIDPARPSSATDCDNASPEAQEAGRLLAFVLPKLLNADGTLRVGTEDIFQITGIIGDPGPDAGKTVRITVLVTEATCTTDDDDPDAAPTCEEGVLTSRSSVTLQLVRPAGELAVALSSGTARLTPEGDVVVTATVSGGDPFTARFTAAADRCEGPSADETAQADEVFVADGITTLLSEG
ncbi:MAG: hypothetical protein IIB60_00265, partial [Planctomycetes bacterium]|nr:hypothetical protein [Planctomycetota bacterium]